MAKITDLFKGSPDRDTAQQFLDYFDGKQIDHLLQTQRKIRKNALTKGLQQRHRNLTKKVVESSGLLFNGKAPVMQVFTGPNDDVLDEDQTQALLTWLDSCDWIEFFTNFDMVVRMLRTGVVLWQYIASTPDEEAQLFPLILGQHNCAIHVDNVTRKMDTLVYCTGKDGELTNYRVWTPELIQDISVDHLGQEAILNVEPNPYGAIPASVFHDTNIPREGFWNTVPKDLIEINHIYNMGLSDSEYSGAWAKFQTLFTNAKVEASDNGAGLMVPINIPGTPYDKMVPTSPAALGGPDTIIEIDTSGVDTPFVEYKGPKPDLLPLHEIVDKWVIDFAADWSVNISMETNGADSGFKLIVKEMPNLELRKKRQKMFEAGFHRMFKVIKMVVNKWHPGTFTDDAELFATFSPPELPIDEKTTEEVWSRRIKEGRASRKMYFMQVHGMTPTEAEQTIKDIDDALKADAVSANGGQPIITAQRNTTENTTTTVSV